MDGAEEILSILPALALVIEAGFVLVLISAMGILVYLFAKAIRPAPLFGDTLADIITNFWDNTTASARASFDFQVRNLNDLVAFVSGMIQGVLNAATTTAEWLGVQAGNALTGLGNLAGDVATQGANLLALVQTTVQNLVDLAAKVEALAADVVQHVLNAVAKQIAETTSALHAALTAEIKAITHPLHAFIVQVHAQLRAALTDEINRATSIETSLSTQIVDAQATVESELESVRTAVLRKLQGVEGTLEGDIGSILDVIGTVAAGSTLVGLIEGIATEVTTMERECVTPTCSFLGPQLDVLNALSSAATLAAFGGLIAFAVANPKGGAGLVVDGADAVHGLAAPIFSGLTGLPA